MKTILRLATAALLLLALVINTAIAQKSSSPPAGIVQQYGRNAASSLQSVTADPVNVPLLRNYSSVNDELLKNPPASDWLVWRRTYDNMGYSPLDSINRQTVSNLQLAWHQPVTSGNNMPTPLVHDGVMFLYSAGDVVLAMDATNGELLWRYSHDGGAVTSHKFGVMAPATPS